MSNKPGRRRGKRCSTNVISRERTPFFGREGGWRGRKRERSLPFSYICCGSVGSLRQFTKILLPLPNSTRSSFVHGLAPCLFFYLELMLLKHFEASTRWPSRKTIPVLSSCMKRRRWEKKNDVQVIKSRKVRKPRATETWKLTYFTNVMKMVVVEKIVKLFFGWTNDSLKSFGDIHVQLACVIMKCF